MDHFGYKNGVLHAEEVSIPTIAQEVGTPFYCYATATLRRHYQVFSGAFSAIPTMVCFAVKANSNLAVLNVLANEGAGADTVSEGEIRRAVAAGIDPNRIVFSGVGKTASEMRYALSQRIKQFNVESVEELDTLNEVARSMDTTARIAVRVNPDIDAETHDKISTGRKSDKFGVAWERVHEAYEHAASLSHIEIVGVTTHIGSQLTKLYPFERAFKRISELVVELRAKGYSIQTLDLGGGLGIPYNNEMPPAPEDYASMIVDTVKHLDCELVLEPGRLIAGNAGILVTEIALIKHAPEHTFVIVDSAMNDLLRPSMYDAYHEIVPVKEMSPNDTVSPVDIVGPVCESADVFGRNRLLPPLAVGDLLALRSAGAYGAVMSSSYNTRPLIPEVLVDGNKYAIVRQRPSYEEILAQDTIPEWL